MLSYETSPDDELSALARDVQRVAESIDEPAIRTRLIEMANELFDLAVRDRTRL